MNIRLDISKRDLKGHYGFCDGRKAARTATKASFVFWVTVSDNNVEKTISNERGFFSDADLYFKYLENAKLQPEKKQLCFLFL